MTIFRLLAGAAAIGALAAPAAAQYYPQPAYPQQGYPVQTYPPQAYPGYPGYAPGYNQNPVAQIIDQLLGNRYNVTDRQAVSRCASAVLTQAAAQYGSGYGAYGQRYGQQYGQGYNRNAAMRVTSITDVQRRNNGLRVSGLMNSGMGYPPNGQAYGYQNRGYAAAGDLSFRCNVDYRGAVTNIRIRRAYG